MNAFKIILSIVTVSLTIYSCSGGGEKTEIVTEEKATPVTISVINETDLNISKIYTGTLRGQKEAKIFLIPVWIGLSGSLMSLKKPNYQMGILPKSNTFVILPDPFLSFFRKIK